MSLVVTRLSLRLQVLTSISSVLIVRLRFIPMVGISLASAKRKIDVKLDQMECVILFIESEAVSLLLLLLARAGVFSPGSLHVTGTGGQCWALAPLGWISD